MDDSKILISFFIIILLGFIYNQIWLSFVIAGVLFLLLFVPGQKAPSKSNPNVIIKPIKVQRKYEKGASIYPEKMEITLGERGPPKAWEKGPEPIGKAVGRSLKWLFNQFK